MADTNYDLVVVGGGPAGYAGAIRAGQLGKKVACVELERAGGTCLNWGCIPSKALLKAAETYHAAQHAGEFGLTIGEISVDFAKVMKRSRNVSGQMAKGVEFLFKKNKVDYFLGRGQINSAKEVEITEGKDKGKKLKTERILLATGCKSRRIPDIEVDGKRVFTSREALVMEKQPKSIIVLGAGAIGAEFAYFLQTLGTEVTLVEMLPAVLPLEDTDISRAIERSFKKAGMKIHTGTKAENIKVSDKGVSLDLVKDDKTTKAEAEALLLAIGVVPYTEGLFGKGFSIATDKKGYFEVDKNYATSEKGIYAAGDIIGPPWLAHVATFEAVQAVNGMFGHGQPKHVDLFPACTYCHPPVASVGLTEQKVKEKGIDYKVG